MLTNFLLLITDLLLSVILFPLGLLFTLCFCLFRLSPNKALDYLSKLILSLALNINLMGNVICGDLFNTYLRKTGGYSFGRYNQTISAVLGHNKALGTLTDLGRMLANLLNFIDEEHVEKAIKSHHQL